MNRILVVAGMALLCACSSSAKITHTWVAEDIHEKDLDGVLVLAIAEQAESRQRFERQFTDALQKRGVRAVASYELKGGAKITKEDVIAMAGKANVDTVLITAFAGRDTQEVLNPGRTYYAVSPVYRRGYYGGGGHVYAVPYAVHRTPDFWAQHKSVHLEANLYAIASEEHLWVAASGIDETDDVEAMLKSFIAAFMNQLAKQNLVN